MESVNTIYSRCSYDMSATRYIFDTICPLRGRNLCREAAYRGKGKKRNSELNKEVHAPPKCPPACGRVGWAVSDAWDLPHPKQIKGKLIQMRRIRRGGFFPLRSAKRNISHHEVIYRIRRIYHAEGISCALRAQGEGAKTSRKREVLLLPSGRQGRRPLEAQGVFRPLRRST